MTRKKQILNESFKLFAKQGFYATSMQQIGEAVGLDKSSIYSHFKNKDEIFFDILNNERDNYLENVVNKLTPEADDFISFGRELFSNIVRHFSNRSRLLFWKQVSLLASGADTIEARRAHKVLTEADKLIQEKFRSFHNNETEEEHQKQLLCLSIISQGVLDWFMVQKKVNEHTMQSAVGIFDCLTNNQLIK